MVTPFICIYPLSGKPKAVLNTRFNIAEDEVIPVALANTISLAQLSVNVRLVPPVYEILALIIMLRDIDDPSPCGGKFTVKSPTLDRWLVITLG